MLSFVFAFLLALLPSQLKIVIYRRLFHYKIGNNVRIGVSPFVGVKICEIGDNVEIGHLNLFTQIERLVLGAHTRIGFLNLVRGGNSVRCGRYVTVLRQNTFNSILDRDFVEPADAVLELGDGVFVAAGHWLDFSDRISIGAHTIIGGRNSSIWTHNRQRAKPITIGEHCYLGSEVRVAPGATLPPFSLVALGAVLTGEVQSPCMLIGGNPAGVVRPLNQHDSFLILHKTRNDIPDDLAFANVPPEVLETFAAKSYVSHDGGSYKKAYE